MNTTPPDSHRVVAAHFADFSWTMAYRRKYRWYDASDNSHIRTEIVGWSEIKEAPLARAERIAAIEMARLEREQRRAAA